MRATTIAPTGPPPLRKRCVAGGVGEKREQRRDGGSQKKLTTVHDQPKRDRVADTGIRRAQACGAARADVCRFVAAPDRAANRPTIRFARLVENE
jgi:hypothetical protein